MAARKKDPNAAPSGGSSSAALPPALQKLAAAINKTLKIQPVSGHKGPHPCVSTGSFVIDSIIGGGPAEGGGAICPGFPRKKITEIFGNESCGKCLTADHLVMTGNGWMTVAEIFETCGVSMEGSPRVVPASFPLINRDGCVENLSHLTVNGVQPLIGIRGEDGTFLKTTSNHPHLVLEQGYHVWKNAEDIRPGDYLVAPVSVGTFGSTRVASDDAYLVGAFIADAHFGEIKLTLTNDDPTVLGVARSRGPVLLGVTPKEYLAKSGSIDLHFNYKDGVRSFYASWGLSAGKAKTKLFSREVRELCRESLGHLVAGYLDCEASYSGASFEVSSASEGLLDGLRLILRQFGVFASVKPKKVKSYPENAYWRLSVSGQDLDTLFTQIPFRRDFGYSVKDQRPPTRSIPGISSLVRTFYASGSGMTRFESKLAADLKTGQTKNSGALLRLLSAVKEKNCDPLLGEHLQKLTEYEYVRVLSTDSLPPEPTYDVVMPSTHSFVAEGVVTHNTTVCLAAIAKVQKAGGTALFLDFEHAIDHAYAKAIGVDFDKLLIYAPNTMEEGLAISRGAIAAGVDIIVVDSLAAMVPRDELAKGIDENAKVGAVAKKLAETLPKFATWLDTLCPEGSKGTAMIWINQMRALISTGPSYGGDDANVNTAGGKALKFYCSVRLKLNKVRSEQIERTHPITGKKVNQPFGNVVECRVVKNKVNGTQGHRANFFIRYGTGVDEARTVIEAAVTHGLIKRTGPTYVLGANSFKGQEALRRHLLTNQAEFQALYDAVVTAVAESAPQAISDEDMDEEDEISTAMENLSADPAGTEEITIDDSDLLG